MSEIKTIVFSKRAILRLKNIADFIYKKSLSNEITVNYINRLKAYISIEKIYLNHNAKSFRQRDTRSSSKK